MKIDLPELERKLSYGINLTIKESTILLESMEGFIDDKIVLKEQLDTAKKALEYIINSNDTAFGFVNSNLRRYVEDALAAIGGDDE